MRPTAAGAGADDAAAVITATFAEGGQISNDGDIDGLGFGFHFRI